jgi:nitrogen fixation-related uncharacterized protein
MSRLDKVLFPFLLPVVVLLVVIGFARVLWTDDGEAL